MGIAAFFAGGQAFFWGAALLALVALLPSNLRRFRFIPGGAAVLGAALVLLSATPLPMWFYTVWAVVIIAWYVFRKRRELRIRRGLGAALTASSLAAFGMELPRHFAPSVPAFGFRRLFVIGDSLSAGTGAPGEQTWPSLIASRAHVEVRNLALAGATTSTAIKQVAQVPDDAALVLIEIGGNDLLSGRSAADFAHDLDALLIAVCKPSRCVVLVELPLPPFSNGYGRAQRRSAAAHGALLVPKRRLASVLAADGATVDGLHLSNRGHQLLADSLWDVLSPGFAAPSFSASAAPVDSQQAPPIMRD